MRISVDSQALIRLDDLSHQQLEDIKRSLTLATPSGGMFGGGGELVECFTETRDHIMVPRNWPKLWPYLRRGFEDNRSYGRRTNLRFKGAPRTGQNEFVGKIVRQLKLNDEFGCIGRAGVGFGKTVCAAMLTADLGTTTLFVAHKEELLRQFTRTCERFLGVTPGWIQGKQCDFKGYPVCVGMIQSLFQNDYPPDFYSYFGLVIYDEAHRVAANTFIQAVNKLNSRWRIGVTATPRRGDKLEAIFNWNLGPVAVVGKGDAVDCDVWRLLYKPRIDKSSYVSRGRPSLSRFITALCKLRDRNNKIQSTLGSMVRHGRKVLALTARVEHVDLIYNRMLRELDGTGLTVGRYLAGSTKAVELEREQSKKADLTIASTTMAFEGLDIPEKDLLCLLTPVGDVEQAAGRVRRPLPGKKRPIVVEIVDDHDLLENMHLNRITYYKTTGLDKRVWNIRDRNFAG